MARLYHVLVLSFLATISSAVPLQEPPHELYWRDDAPVTAGITPELLANFQLFADFSAASYCTNNQVIASAAGTPITCNEGVCPLVEANNATSVVQFGGLGDDSINNIRGYVALDPVRSLIVVVFAGSSTIRNYISDLAFVQIPYFNSECFFCWVDAGFKTGWTEVRSTVLAAVANALMINPSYPIIVTGHSLGGAIATLAAAELRSSGHHADLYTYGSPRVGNPKFARFVTNQAPGLGSNYRVTHFDDPVPQVPPVSIGYSHVSPEYWLGEGPATRDIYQAADVQVCTGFDNVNCNEGTDFLNLDVDAHYHYLGDISACSSGKLIFR